MPLFDCSLLMEPRNASLLVYHMRNDGFMPAYCGESILPRHKPHYYQRQWHPHDTKLLRGVATVTVAAGRRMLTLHSTC